MIDIKKKSNELLDRVRKYFVGTDKLENKNKVARKKWLNLGLVIIGAFITFIVILLFIASNEKKQKTRGLGDDLASIAKNSYGNAGGGNNTDIASKHQKKELGTDAIKGEVKWQNFLEESIETEGKTREEQISILKESINKHHTDTREESGVELKELKDRFSYLVGEIELLKACKSSSSIPF
jgi:hypothetical protein